MCIGEPTSTLGRAPDEHAEDTGVWAGTVQWQERPVTGEKPDGHMVDALVGTCGARLGRDKGHSDTGSPCPDEDADLRAD